MKQHAGNWSVIAVIVVGVLFSAYNNMSLFLSIFGTDIQGWIFSAAGLSLFDAGAVGWAAFFAYGAKGSAQRLIAFAVSVVCLFLTITAAGLHLLLAQHWIYIPDWAGTATMFTIVGALAVNLVGGYAAHMTNPDVLFTMKRQDSVDKITQRAFKKTDEKVEDIADDVADELAESFKAAAVRQALTQKEAANAVGRKKNEKAEKPADETIQAPVEVADADPKAPALVTVSRNGKGH